MMEEDIPENISYQSTRLLLNPNGSVKDYFPVTPEMRYYDEKIEALEKKLRVLAKRLRKRDNDAVVHSGRLAARSISIDEEIVKLQKERAYIEWANLLLMIVLFLNILYWAMIS